MSSNTKERLLHDLEALRHQLAEIEAYGTDQEGEVPAAVNIPTLETDNIPLLGDAVPADRDEAIAAHRAAMAQLDAELKELDKKEQTVAANNSVHGPAKVINASEDSANTPAEVVELVISAEPTTIESTPKTNDPMPSHTLAPTMKAPTQIAQKPTTNVTPNLPTSNKTASPVKPSVAPKAPITPQTFSLEGIAPTMTASKPAVTSDDNPFLPAHLRERLNKSKSSLLEEIARSSESLDASTALLRNFGQGSQPTQHARPQNSEAHYQDIVDTLVAKYLPLIEADLRQRLTTALAQQVAAQKNPEHSH